MLKTDRYSLVRFSLLVLLALSFCGCSSTGFGLFIANSVAGLAEFNVVKSVNYGPLEAHELDIYIPNAYSAVSNQKLPVVIFFYGGCWGACSTYTKDKYAFVAEVLTTNNYIAVIADYRLYPDVLFPDIIADASLVVEWVKENIEEYGGDGDSLFLMGHSAGAHLAAMLTTDERHLESATHDSIKGFVGMAGPYDFLPFDEHYQRILFGPPENYPDSQPVNFVDGSEPPMLLLYGDRDRVVKSRNIENMFTRANEAGIDVTRHLYTGINHSGLVAALSRVLRNKKPVARDVVDFLDKNST